MTLVAIISKICLFCAVCMDVSLVRNLAKESKGDLLQDAIQLFFFGGISLLVGIILLPIALLFPFHLLNIIDTPYKDPSSNGELNSTIGIFYSILIFNAIVYICVRLSFKKDKLNEQAKRRGEFEKF